MPDASPLTAKPPVSVPTPDYSETEITYLGGLAERLHRAHVQRNSPHEFLDGMTYPEYWASNERGANTTIEPRKNKEDSNYQSGTVRNKVMASLAPLQNLDLSPNVMAYDENEMRVQYAGEAIEDAMERTSELDTDDDKKLRRQYELVKQGDTFVEEVWQDFFDKKKIPQGKKTFDGTVKGMSWTTRLKRLVSRPVRRIIPGLCVYLGDLTVYDIVDQPFVFTADEKPIAELERQFGTWERWKNVPHDVRPWGDTDQVASRIQGWSLGELQKGYGQVIRYQDPWANEFAILINGVLMTPVGLPLPWGCRYNITQQGLEPVNEKFAYHGSLVKRLKANVAFLDEWKRVLLLKGQKSAVPPSINLSGRVLSKRIFMPGAITSGIQKGDVVPLNEKETEGPTSGEFAIMKELMADIDRASVAPIAAGQEPQGDPTATEILEVQHQAKLMAGLTIAAAAMLEWKLAWQRLWVLLRHWFQPKGTRIEGGREIPTYRTTNIERPIEGEGMGRRVTVLTPELPQAQEVFDLEEEITRKSGVPHRFRFIAPEAVTDSRIVWQVTVTPKEKRTSELSKILFSNMLTDVERLTAMGAVPNVQGLTERHAMVWDETPEKIWSSTGAPLEPMQPAPTPVTAKGVQPPSPQGAASRSIKNQLSA